MNPERIKEIRKILRITQEDLAIIIGVTKTTIGRYEIGLVKPAGQSKVKLIQLYNALNNKEDKQIVVDIINSDTKLAGVIALRAILNLNTSIIPLKYIDITEFSISSAIKSLAGQILFKTIKNVLEKENN